MEWKYNDRWIRDYECEKCKKSFTVSKSEDVLIKTLREKGIECIHQDCVEYETGKYKHIDITIPVIDLNIEVDGIQHYTDGNQMFSDVQRAYWSGRADYNTMHLPSFLIVKEGQVDDAMLDELADAIVQLVRRKIRYSQIVSTKRIKECDEVLEKLNK